MKSIIAFALDRQKLVLTTLFFFIVMGLNAWNTMPREANPDVSIPIIYVSMHHEGISPDDAEKLLIRPMEQELDTIAGLKQISATGYQSGANVVLEFRAGFDKNKALNDVQKAVDKAKSKLPDQTDEPRVDEVNFSLFPVLVVSLSGDLPDRTLYALAKRLQDKVKEVNTVLSANITGNREELVEIVVDPLKVESYGLSGNDVVAFFQRSDRLVAAGNLDTGKGRFAVKVPGTFNGVADIISMPVKVSGDAVVTVGDIATVKRTFKDAESIARINGKRAVALEIVKRTGENIIDTIDKVKKVVETERASWPAGVQISYTQDQSKDIRNMLTDLQNNVLAAVLLVMIVCVGVLGLTSAGLVGVSIPASFLMGIAFLHFMGLTLNIVVLFSLILSVGILVDGAIIVNEYADRKMAEGSPRHQAYFEAATRMFAPITASLLTTIAAFIPLLFWPGVVGQFMKYMPITLIAVLGASLITALIYMPTLGAIFGKPGAMGDEKVRKNLAAMEHGDINEIHGFTGWYVRVLKFALRHPAKVVLTAFAMLIGIQIIYGKFGNGVEFFPNVEPVMASVIVHARGNLSIDEQDAIIQDVEERILNVAGIDTVYTRTGRTGGGGNAMGGSLSADTIGVFQLEFADWQKRKKASVILDEIRSLTKDIPGILVETQKQDNGPPAGKKLQLEIRSTEPVLLIPAANKVREGLAQVGEFIDIEDSRPLPGIEWQIKVDRAQAAKFGLDTSSIGQTVQLVTNGLHISKFRPSDSKDEIDVVIRYPEDQRSLDAIDRLRIETPQGSIPIANFVQRIAMPQIGQVDRVGGLRVLSVKANLPEGVNVDAKIKSMQEWMKKQEWDPRLQFRFRGENEDQAESAAFLSGAFGAALGLIALILIAQFNSFYNTVLVLSSVIMSTIGVFLGLLITGRPFGIVMTGIGVIALAGTIVHNNIVLIDTYEHLKRSKKFGISETILRTGAQRLRPVLLTAMTTALGLVPMVFQVNIDFIGRETTVGAPSTQWWVDLSTAIAFGMVFATPLTLIVTPCALLLHDKAGHGLNRLKTFLIKHLPFKSKNI